MAGAHQRSDVFAGRLPVLLVADTGARGCVRVFAGARLPADGARRGRWRGVRPGGVSRLATEKRRRPGAMVLGRRLQWWHCRHSRRSARSVVLAHLVVRVLQRVPLRCARRPPFRASRRPGPPVGRVSSALTKRVRRLGYCLVPAEIERAGAPLGRPWRSRAAPVDGKGVRGRPGAERLEQRRRREGAARGGSVLAVVAAATSYRVRSYEFRPGRVGRREVGELDAVGGHRFLSRLHARNPAAQRALRRGPRGSVRCVLAELDHGCGER